MDKLNNLFYRRTEWPLNLSAHKDAAGSGDCHFLPKGKRRKENTLIMDVRVLMNTNARES